MRTVTVVDEGVARDLDAEVAGDALWVDAAASGWERKTPGLCRGDLCVPVPRDAEAALVRADGALDLAAVARLRAQEVVRDDGGTLWVFDQPGAVQESVRASLLAPDFTLPDLDGREHSLSAHRGRKVLLASWASW